MTDEKLYRYLRYIFNHDGAWTELIREKRDVLGRRYFTIAFCRSGKESVLSAKQRRISRDLCESMLKDGRGEWDVYPFDN